MIVICGIMQLKQLTGKSQTSLLFKKENGDTFHEGSFFMGNPARIYKSKNLCLFVCLFVCPIITQDKGIEFLPQIQIFQCLYFGNLMVETLDISNLDYLI